MVGPSITGDERRGMARRLKLGFVAVVALSGAFTGVWAGGSAAFVAAGAVGGALLGLALVAYLSWLASEARQKEYDRKRRPEAIRNDEDREQQRDRRAKREKRRKRP